MIENVDACHFGENALSGNDRISNGQMKQCRHLHRQHQNEFRSQLTRSQTLDPEHYRRYNEACDGYNHLKFETFSTLPDKPYVGDCILSENGITKPADYSTKPHTLKHKCDVYY
jgi:hypothetical protein